jgi:hypothetical protein
MVCDNQANFVLHTPLVMENFNYNVLAQRMIKKLKDWTFKHQKGALEGNSEDQGG